MPARISSISIPDEYNLIEDEETAKNYQLTEPTLETKRQEDIYPYEDNKEDEPAYESLTPERKDQLLKMPPISYDEIDFGDLSNLIGFAEFRIMELEDEYSTFRNLKTNKAQENRRELYGLKAHLQTLRVKDNQIRQELGLPPRETQETLKTNEDQRLLKLELELSRQETKLAIKDAELARKEVQLANSNAEIRILNRELELTQKSLEQAEKRQEELKAALEKTNSLIEELRKENGTLNTKLAEETKVKEATLVAVEEANEQKERTLTEKVVDLLETANRNRQIILDSITTTGEKGITKQNIPIEGLSNIQNYIQENSDGEDLKEDKIEIVSEVLRLVADQISRPRIFLSEVTNMLREIQDQVNRNERSLIENLVLKIQETVKVDLDSPEGKILSIDVELIEDFVTAYQKAKQKGSPNKTNHSGQTGKNFLYGKAPKQNSKSA